VDFRRLFALFGIVSTHSRLKAAGPPEGHSWEDMHVSTHSRLKAAGTGNISSFVYLFYGFNKNS